MDILIWIIIFLLLLLPIYVLIFILIPFLFGASYEGSTKEVIEKMLKYSKIRKGEKFVDLGSGDGRIVIAFAQQGFESHGFEVNPLLVLWSRRKIKTLGLENLAFIHWKNFWKEDLSKFDVVSVFQISFIMEKLERKLQKELSRGARVISNTWQFPNWKLVKKDKDIFVYQN